MNCRKAKVGEYNSVTGESNSIFIFSFWFSRTPVAIRTSLQDRFGSHKSKPPDYIC